MERGKRLQSLAKGLLFLSLVGIIFYYKYEARNFKDTAQLQAVELSMFKDSVRIVKQENGQLNFQIQSVEVEKRNLKESLEISGFEIKDLKEKEIRWRKINSTLKAELESVGSGIAGLKDTLYLVETELKTDTVFQQNFTWNNEYLCLRGNVREDELFFNYRYSTPVEIISSKKKKETVITFTLKDPNANIINASSITLEDEKKFYERPSVWAVVGVIAGIVIAK